MKLSNNLNIIITLLYTGLIYSNYIFEIHIAECVEKGVGMMRDNLGIGDETKAIQLTFDYIEENKEQINNNFKENMQYSGVADLYGIQEYTQPLSETRITEHKEFSSEIMGSLSPNNSPTTGQINITSQTTTAIKTDDFQAFKEDLNQTEDFIKETINQTLHNTISPGTYMNYEDAMIDHLT